MKGLTDQKRNPIGVFLASHWQEVCPYIRYVWGSTAYVAWFRVLRALATRLVQGARLQILYYHLVPDSISGHHLINEAYRGDRHYILHTLELESSLKSSFV